MDRIITAPAVNVYLMNAWEDHVENNPNLAPALQVGIRPASFVVYTLIAIEGLVETIFRLALGIFLLPFTLSNPSQNLFLYYHRQISILNESSNLYEGALAIGLCIYQPWALAIRGLLPKRSEDGRSQRPASDPSYDATMLRSPVVAVYLDAIGAPPAVVELGSTIQLGGSGAAQIGAGAENSIALPASPSATPQPLSSPPGDHPDAPPEEGAAAGAPSLPTHHRPGDSLTFSADSTAGEGALQQALLNGPVHIGGVPQSPPGEHRREGNDSGVSYISAVSDGGDADHHVTDPSEPPTPLGLNAFLRGELVPVGKHSSSSDSSATSQGSKAV